MRSILVSILVLLGFNNSVIAFDDEAACVALRSRGASGLYIGYSSFSPAVARLEDCGSPSGICLTKVARSNLFDAGARFYFVPQPIRPPTEEGVWHIRTQTKALNLDGADQAYLARAVTTTRCVRALQIFQGGAAYVPLRDYVEHHSSLGTMRHPRIGELFHFQIQDPPGGPKCIATDDREAFGDLNSIYGFDGVAPPSKRISRAFSIGTAQAATAYAGLSSEFAYHDRSQSPCFGFAVPQPTRTEYLGQSLDWKPYLTTIWIKRLRGRQVSPVSDLPFIVRWDR